MQDSDNEDLQRIFGRLAQGTINFNSGELTRTPKLHADLESIYSKATVCELNDASKCYSLSPYLERLMQVEKDYDRLTWAWKGWHDACGNDIRSVYLPYIDLLNKNVKENGYADLAVSNRTCAFARRPEML